MESNEAEIPTIAASEESRRRLISLSLKGRPKNLTEEQRAVLSARAKRFIGNVPRSEEHKRKISEALKGKARSAQHSANISIAKKGAHLNLSDEERAARSARAKDIHTGKIVSEETRRKLSEARAGVSGLLVKYGVDREEYARQIRAGNRWCTHSKHFAPAQGFASHTNCCDLCKPNYYRKCDLKKTFGKDQEWYLKTLEAQGGGCAICGTTKLAKTKRHFMIDHDHKTGAVRGLLCQHCNFGLERFDSVADWAEKAKTYLSTHSSSAPAQQSV